MWISWIRKERTTQPSHQVHVKPALQSKFLSPTLFARGDFEEIDAIAISTRTSLTYPWQRRLSVNLALCRLMCRFKICIDWCFWNLLCASIKLLFVAVQPELVCKWLDECCLPAFNADVQIRHCTQFAFWANSNPLQWFQDFWNTLPLLHI